MQVPLWIQRLRWPDLRESIRRFTWIAWFARIVSGFPSWTPIEVFLRINSRESIEKPRFAWRIAGPSKFIWLAYPEVRGASHSAWAIAVDISIFNLMSFSPSSKSPMKRSSRDRKKGRCTPSSKRVNTQNHEFGSFKVSCWRIPRRIPEMLRNRQGTETFNSPTSHFCVRVYQLGGCSYAMHCVSWMEWGLIVYQHLETIQEALAP